MKRPDKVIAVIRAVLKGQNYVSGACAVHLAKKYVGGCSTPDFFVVALLSDRELEVISLIGLAPDRIGFRAKHKDYPNPLREHQDKARFGKHDRTNPGAVRLYSRSATSSGN